MALRGATGDKTEVAPSRCRYDWTLWNSIPPYALCVHDRPLVYA